MGDVILDGCMYEGARARSAARVARIKAAVARTKTAVARSKWGGSRKRKEGFLHKKEACVESASWDVLPPICCPFLATLSLHPQLATLKPQYLEPEPEAPPDTTPDVLATMPPKWPAEGGISVVDLEMRYRPDMPLVLQGVSFDVAPGAKVWGMGCGQSVRYGADTRAGAAPRVGTSGLHVPPFSRWLSLSPYPNP
eukprot:363410-Chlamydomonas_euryale.AAC.6